MSVCMDVWYCTVYVWPFVIYFFTLLFSFFHTFCTLYIVQVSSFQATAHGRALKEATVAKRSAPPSNCPRACSSGHNPLTSAGHRQVEWLKRTAVYWLEAYVVLAGSLRRYVYFSSNVGFVQFSRPNLSRFSRNFPQVGNIKVRTYLLRMPAA